MGDSATAPPVGGLAVLLRESAERAGEADPPGSGTDPLVGGLDQGAESAEPDASELPG